MKYEGTLLVNKEEAEELERFCQVPPGADNVFGKGRPLFDKEYVFPDGMRMAIQVIPTDNPNEESCWTQGVLFARNGEEVGCTDVSDSFLQEYRIRDFEPHQWENEYVVTVKPGDVPPSNQ